VFADLEDEVGAAQDLRNLREEFGICLRFLLTDELGLNSPSLLASEVIHAGVSGDAE
jgi:hypothetical protein